MRFALTTGLNGSIVDDRYTVRKFQADNPNISIRADWSTIPEERINAYNIFVVNETDRPALSDPITKTIVAAPFIWNGNRLDQVWIEVDADAETIAQRQQIAQDTADKTAVTADSFIPTFLSMTPVQIDAYIDARIADSETANIIKKLARMVLILGRLELR